ncbi:hypothetical protein BH09VER1_BH09VER1_30970 [soil metagenome]
MSFQYTVLVDQSLILVRFDGSFSVADLTGSAVTICADERYVRGFDGLIDLSGVEISISVEDVRELVAYTLERKKHGHGKWAVLVTGPIATAYMMVFQHGVDGEHPVSLFSSFEGVSEFLDREIDRKSFEAALNT